MAAAPHLRLSGEGRETDDNSRQILIAIVSAIVGIVVAGLGIRAGSKAVEKAAANQKSAQDAAWAREDRWRWAAEKRTLYERFLEGADLLRRIAYDLATHGQTDKASEFGTTAQDMLTLASKMAVIAEPLTTAAAQHVNETSLLMLSLASRHRTDADGMAGYEAARTAFDISVSSFQRITREELTGVDALEGLPEEDGAIVD